VINRCLGDGILLSSSTGGNTVQGNFIGTDPTGTISLGVGGSGVSIFAQTVGTESNDVIGGTSPADRNIVSGAFRGISAAAGSGHLVQGNLIGTDAPGTHALPNGVGIFIESASCTIGGTTSAARNVISGNSSHGVSIGSFASDTIATLNVVEGNFIGTDLTGTLALGNGGDGIEINGVINTIGGTTPGSGNVISVNAGRGINVATGDGSFVRGNLIGTDVTGTAPLGNKGPGVEIAASNVMVGGTTAGSGNVIAFNGANDGIGGGVLVYGAGNTIRRNSIFANTSLPGGHGLGIDLGGDGVTPNDPCDVDTGPNKLQNFPIITSVAYGASSTTVHAVLNSAASTMYDLDFYANPSCSPRPQGFLQGETYLGTTAVTTDGSCNATLDVVLPVAVAAGSRLTATATDPSGNTSEFSQRIVLSAAPKAGAPSGGTSITLSGMLFQSPATVTVGGAAATSVNVVDPKTITCTTPALSSGSVSPIVVTTGGLTGTLLNAWVAYFNDVPVSNLFNAFVDKLVANEITAGCGGGNYCPDSFVTRAQMSVFLLRGKNGLCYFPPPATGTVFLDVPIGSFAAAYIEALAALSITGGCGGGNYCPTSPVTRAQMSVFLLRTQEGPTYAPPACTTATFTDVPCSNPFSKWIYELVRRGITAGCGGGNYCPDDSVTRGQMAVFLTTTFGIP
jgi:hypothetical protein